MLSNINPLSRSVSSSTLLDALCCSFVSNAQLPVVCDRGEVVTYGELYQAALNYCSAFEQVKKDIVVISSRPSIDEIAKLVGILFAGKAYSVEPVANLEKENVAAVMLTSGSAGKAKAIALSHDCVHFFASTYMHHMALSAGDRISLFPSLAVGVSISNLFSALLAGATLYPIHFNGLGVERTVQYLIKNKLTVLHLVPSLFRVLAKHPEIAEALRFVHHLKLGGEAVTQSDAELFFSVSKYSTRLMNGLGITEAGGNVTFGEILPGDVQISIGKPIEGIKAEILAREDGVGELVVTGRHLASGYLEESDAFTFNGDGTISVRTGDLVKVDDNGKFFHLGRSDDAVKINGQRFYLQEIDALLGKIPGVDTAVAVVDSSQSGSPAICGVLVSREVPKVANLRSYTGNLPIRFYHLAHLPLQGKLSRREIKALITTLTPLREASAKSPTGILEAHLLSIWQKAFGSDQIGIQDSFFALGGDSMGAAELALEIGQQLQADIPLEQIYRNDTIEKLAASLEDWREVSKPAVVLRRGEDNLFLVPGAGSDVVSLWHLAQALPTSLNVVGLQYPGLDGKSRFLKSVPEMARFFLSHVRQIQPRGPYRITGTSFGGLVAFEMVRQLEAEGESVRCLCMIDTYAPGYLRFRRSADKIKALKYWILPTGKKDNWSAKGLREGVAEKLLLARARLGLPMPFSRRFYYLMEACFHASRNYSVVPISTPVTIFTVERQLPPDLFLQDQFLGWQGCSTGAVEAEKIPGAHGSHIRPPHVFTLARKLADRLSS